jgi:putative flippase GtrA
MTAPEKICPPRPWVLIPAYQPDEAFPPLMRALSECVCFDRVLVVDDGSSPDKKAFFDQVEGLPGLTIIRHAVNRGKGQALKTGFNYYLLNSPPSSPGLVSGDADGQHLPEDIERVARAGAEAKALALGRRTFSKDIPFRSRLGNIVSSFFFAMATGTKIRDTQTGLRFFPRDSLPAFMAVPGDRFDYEFAALVHLSTEMSQPIVEVPIQTLYFRGNSGSHYRALVDTAKIMGVFLRFLSLSISTAAVDYAVFFLSSLITVRILPCFILARAVSVLYNFTFSRKWVFRVKADLYRQLFKYIGLVLVFMAVAYGLTSWLSARSGWPVLVCKLEAEGALFLLSFLVQRHFIFRKRKRAPQSAAAL